jgi:hypothetical protein
MRSSTGTLGDPAAPRSPWMQRFRIAAVLAVVCGAGAAMVLPYMAAMLPELLEAPLPLWALAIVSGLQSGILCGVLALIGLGASSSLGLELPHLSRWINGPGEGPSPTWRGLTTSITIGAVVATLAVVIDLALMLPTLTPLGQTPPTPGPVVGLLASFYGGIAEEVLVRLFLLSAIAWVLVKIGVGKQPALHGATVLAAILFGLGHLPTAVRLFELDGALVVRTLVLNGMLGVPFGLIYIRRGLEQAIASHFVADLVLHVLFPALVLAGVIDGGQ